MNTRLSTLCNEKLPDIVDTPALTGEYFPGFPLNGAAALRFGRDETKDGRLRLHVNQAKVCRKTIHAGSNLKPGLMTVYCHTCRLLVGWSLLDEPETVRTCYNVFKHRNFAKGYEPPDNPYGSDNGNDSDEQGEGDADSVYSSGADNATEDEDRSAEILDDSASDSEMNFSDGTSD